MSKHDTVESTMNKLVGRDNPYRYTVSENLYLLIKPTSRKYWRWDYKYKGKRNTISIGVFPKVSLFQAVIKANDIICQLRQGFDPAPRKKDKLTKKAQTPTFREVTLQYAETRGVSWNQKNWLAILAIYHLGTSMSKDSFRSGDLIECHSTSLYLSV